MPTHHQNPSAYIDARGIARVQMPEQQEGFAGPRVSNMVRSLGISRADAMRLRERMRTADEKNTRIEDILRDAQRLLRAKSVAYYPGAADLPDAPDGIAFVDRGNSALQTLMYDHRDGRFTVNAWGPAVARQRERFSKKNPASRYTPDFFWSQIVPSATRHAREEGATILVTFDDRFGAWAMMSAAQQPRTRRTFAEVDAEGNVVPGPAWDTMFANAKNNPDSVKRQNPPRTIVCLTGFGDWWSVSENQWPKVVRAGMAGDNEAAVKQATRVRQKPSVAVGSAVPVLRSVFDLTPEDWEYYDKEVRDAAAAAERAREAARRKNPQNTTTTGAPMPTQFVTNPRRPAKKRSARRKNPSPRPSVATLARAGFSRTQANDLRDKMDGLSVFTVLKAADKMLDGHGVEYIESLTDTSRNREGLSYVNMGDTYMTTLIYDHRSGRFVVSSWGDIVERDSKRFGY